MLDNFLKLIKENFQTVITIATFSLTGLYGIICFLIYIYTRGYSDALNIQSQFIHINYIEYIYIVAFLSIYFFYFIFVAIDIKKILKYPIAFKEKLFILIRYFLFSFLLFRLNISLLNHESVYLLKYLFIYFALLSVIIIFSPKYDKNNKTISNIIDSILAFIIVLPLMVTGIYDRGYNKFTNYNAVYITIDNEYVVVYCNGDQYILSPFEINGKNIIVDNNIHKVVNVSNTTTKIIDVKSIRLKRP